MPAAFKVINEYVCFIKYTEPLLARELDDGSEKLIAYAQTVTHPLVVIADYTAVRRISASLLSVGLRPGSANPLRNPTIGKIIVITRSPMIVSLASIVSRVLQINKLVAVNTHTQVAAEVEAFLRKHSADTA